MNNKTSLFKRFLIWAWKRKIWYGWKVNFNGYHHWSEVEFNHRQNHVGVNGSVFLVWWAAFAGKHFKGPYEFDKSVVRFYSKRDMDALKAKLNEPIYFIELESEVFNLTDMKKYLLERRVPFDFILKHSSKIYGLDTSKLDQMEFKLKFGKLIKVETPDLRDLMIVFPF
jgi:hypothetical protein